MLPRLTLLYHEYISSVWRLSCNPGHVVSFPNFPINDLYHHSISKILLGFVLYRSCEPIVVGLCVMRPTYQAHRIAPEPIAIGLFLESRLGILKHQAINNHNKNAALTLIMAPFSEINGHLSRNYLPIMISLRQFILFDSRIIFHIEMLLVQPPRPYYHWYNSETIDDVAIGKWYRNVYIQCGQWYIYNSMTLIYRSCARIWGYAAHFTIYSSVIVPIRWKFRFEEIAT